jgi:hypothetical protein
VLSVTCFGECGVRDEGGGDRAFLDEGIGWLRTGEEVGVDGPRKEAKRPDMLE